MGNKVFIGGINFDTKDEDLKAELSKYGTLLSFRVVVDHETGKSRGFGFATFKTEEGAKAAMDAMDNELFEGKRIGVKPHLERKGRL